MTSDVQKGYVKFHSHSEHKESFYYDLFYIKGNLPDQYLQIYNDNKTMIHQTIILMFIYLHIKLKVDAKSTSNPYKEL